MSISTGLRTLLIATKEPRPPTTWQEVGEVLAPVFAFDMSFHDVLVILCGAHQELIAEPRFQVGQPQKQAFDLLTAPIKGYFKVVGLQDSMTVEQFYNSMVEHMVSEIRLSRVDWCKHELYPENSESPKHA